MSENICARCGLRIYGGKRFLNEHMYQVHKEKAYHCDKCNRNFASESGFKNHMGCSSTIEHSCSFPGCTYKGSRNALKTHEKRHEDKGFTCQTCGKTYTSSRRKAEHLQECSRRYKCPWCTKTFPSETLLEGHKAYCINKQEKYRKIRALFPVIPPVKLVNQEVASKKKDELQNSLKELTEKLDRSLPSPVKSPQAYSLTNSQKELELSPLQHISFFMKGAGKGKEKAPLKSSSKFVEPFQSKNCSPKSYLVNSPNSNKFRSTLPPTTAATSSTPLIVPKIGPPVIPRSKRRLLLDPESKPSSSKAFRSPYTSNASVSKPAPISIGGTAAPSVDKPETDSAGIIQINNSFLKKTKKK